MKKEHKTFYRVRPAHEGFAHQDFDDFDEALKNANERNSLRLTAYPMYSSDTLYKGDNCIILRVEQVITCITV